MTVPSPNVSTCSSWALCSQTFTPRTRKLSLGAGTVEPRVPWVNDRRLDGEGRRERFTSRILLPYMDRSPKVAEVLLPILYLRGFSPGDFHPV